MVLADKPSDNESGSGQIGQEQKTKNPSFSLPPDNLYIYYLKGKILYSELKTCPYFIGNWEEDDLSFLFFSQSCPKLISKILNSNPQIQLIDEYQTTYREWQGGTVNTFTEGNLKFCPVWQKPWIEEEKTVIKIDPGVVFGTGNHKTTRDCLKALRTVLENFEVVNTVLDLGAGSGLLSLAATKLGVARTMAVDLNPLAVTTTNRNIRINHLEDLILAVQGRAEECIQLPADLLIANIHYEVVEKLLNSPHFLEKKFFILSGLLSSQAKQVLKTVESYPVEIMKVWQDGDVWTTICGKRN